MNFFRYMRREDPHWRPGDDVTIVAYAISTVYLGGWIGLIIVAGIFVASGAINTIWMRFVKKEPSG